MHISFATKFYPNDVYVGWKSSDSLKNENYKYNINYLIQIY